MHKNSQFMMPQSPETQIKENADKDSMMVSDCLREVVLSDKMRKCMGIVKDSDGDWRSARAEWLDEKYGI